MEHLDIDIAQRSVTLGPDRRAATVIGGLMAVYAAVLLTMWTTGVLTFGVKAYLVLAVSLLAPLGMVIQAGRRSHRVAGQRLFVSGPFGIGSRSFDLANAKLQLIHVFVVGQSAYRLAWTFPDGEERAMSTMVADRQPLLDALRRWMTDPTADADHEAIALADAENATQRAELVRFTSIAIISIGAGAAWIVWG